jgi:DNA-binding NtrC family response regulator
MARAFRGGLGRTRRTSLKRPDSGTDTAGMALRREGQALEQNGTSGAGGIVSPGANDRGLVLVVDDEPLMLRSVRRILEADAQRVVLAQEVEHLDVRLSDPSLDVVLLDLVMGATSGLEVLERLKRERPEVEVIVMTGHASIESAVGCMRRGAFDYLEKPFEDVHRVRTTVRKAVERRRLVRRNRELEAELLGREPFSGLLGSSTAMRSLVRSIRSLRHNESSVVISGESGTGKELAARALHATSPRAAGPFVPVDCGALPEAIFESELFGHEKGAFTDAVGAEGLFRRAHRGTLFLDEVGELPASVQAKLLRALQQREVRPLGATAAIPVDIRIVCATHRDLQAMVAAGTFRADLYYRLNVVNLGMPPLRERLEDVPLLVHHFLHKHARAGDRAPGVGIDDDALAALARRDWPGNVRELENTIESALALTHESWLRRADVEPAVRVFTDPRSTPAGGVSLPCEPFFESSPPELSLAAYERCALDRALRESNGDATAAAARLGIGRSTFYRKLAKRGIRPLEVGANAPSGVGASEPIR